MTALERLRRLAEEFKTAKEAKPGTMDAEPFFRLEDEYIDATTPEAILALIADVERLIAQAQAPDGESQGEGG